ncbi:MAG: helix-turn-helix transcriptional regulator [Ruminococcaceae bacterium]|nr:helix-turn-helix transcriptional regulator [Oscillospiraceae bacterium]
MRAENFALRLARLRTQKGVSARDMSLSIGQNASYINTIESGKALPSLTVFFYICEYLGVTPRDFFDEDIKNPEGLNSLIQDLSQLDDSQLQSLSVIVKGLIKK